MIITNATLVTWETPNRILEGPALSEAKGHAMVLEDGVIVALGPQAELRKAYPDQVELDARGQLVMPANICAHTHFYGAFARGMAIPGQAPRDFPEILQKLWWGLDKALTLEDVHASTQVMLVDAIRNGVTTLIDHHASPNAIEGSLDMIADAVDKSGLRAVLCYEVTDRDGEAKARQGIAENVRFLERLKREQVGGGRLAGTFGLHASLTLSDATLEACRREAPQNAGFHLHVAEHPVDQYDSLAKSSLRVIDRLEKFGLLGERSILAHCVHVDAREVETISRTGAWVTHQPRSNMNNAVGAADVESQLRAGVRVCLGTDGFASAIWEEAKTAYLLPKAWNRDPQRMSALDVIQMAVYNNARLANLFFPGTPLGVLKVGAQADLIFVDYHPQTPLTTANLPWHIVFGFQERMITTTIAAGRVLMLDHRLQTLDETAIAARARELASQTWQRYQKIAGAN
jgi:putative selenium metabolism protein SsnA